MSGYVIGIHSNVAPSAEFIAGHAWITLHRGQIVTSYGLWPDEHPAVKNNGKGTDVRIGLEPPKGLANRYYALTPVQYAELLRLITETVHWAYTNNCSSWASSIVYNVLHRDVDANDWLGLETPRELARSIQQLERKDPTSINSPKIVK